jgi:hypothetical protein
MSIRKAAMASIVAASMVAMPAVAQTASANQTAASKAVASAPVARKGAKTTKQSDLRGGSIILALLAAGAVIAGIVIAADGGNSPTSP